MRKIEEPETLNRSDFCGKCQTSNVVTSQRGFNVMTMMLWFIVSFATAIICTVSVPLLGLIFAFLIALVGFFGSIIAGAVGKGKVINMCANCGNKWEPGK